jgi:hypothetical protein
MSSGSFSRFVSRLLHFVSVGNPARAELEVHPEIKQTSVLLRVAGQALQANHEREFPRFYGTSLTGLDRRWIRLLEIQHFRNLGSTQESLLCVAPHGVLP